MFLVNVYIQAIVIIAVVVVFLLAVILNHRTPVPKGTEMPEQCQFCPSKTCVLKSSDLAKKKEEMKAYLENCEEKNERKED
ncbi:MAG: hypothetical protein GX661_05380 [Acholeplasmataceae bacterium]|nr:hypothetical protein [Acholeplasmataceae bacterium]